MLLKSKICFTTIAIYEIIAVSILHFQRICDTIFPVPFCDSWYRYFLFCVIVPTLALLIWMWIREIVRVRRRHKFIRRAKNAVHGIISGIRTQVSEHLAPQDIEKLITAAALIGIKRYADRHPNLRKNISGLTDTPETKTTPKKSAPNKKPRGKKPQKNKK